MGKFFLPTNNIMKIKSLKYISIGLILSMSLSILTGCSSNNKNDVKEEITYKKVEIGEVPFAQIDEYGDEHKYIRQWIIENKETEGLYTKMFEGNTYVLYATGEKTHYGYGFSGVNLYKKAENEPITFTVIETEPDFSFAKEEVNYPYVAVKISGNIKDEIKEDVIKISENQETETETQNEDNENQNEDVKIEDQVENENIIDDISENIDDGDVNESQ